jgi:hypothetical protein
MEFRMIEQGQAVSETAPSMIQSLPPELERIVRVLCDTYEELDLRIETTLGAAENDFLAALPEIEGHETELRRMVTLLIDDLGSAINGMKFQPVLLRLTFHDEGELTEQLLTNLDIQGTEQ